MKVKVLVAQSCPTLCNPTDCSPPGSSVHGILQARILEWVVRPFSRGSSQPMDQIQVFCIAGGFFTIWASREALSNRSHWSASGENTHTHTHSVSSYCNHRADSPVGTYKYYHCSLKTNQKMNHHCRGSGKVEYRGEEMRWKVGQCRHLLMMANGGAMQKKHIPVTSHNPLIIFLYPIFQK